MEELLLKNVNKSINKRPILYDINLSLKKGKIYGFQGENGAGKTMLFRAISGLIHIDSGEINVFGKKIGKDISFPDSLGLTIENVGFWKNFTGAECLETLRRIKKAVPKSAVKNALQSVGLNPNDKRQYKEYSLGMKQKLAIAQAIMEEPEIVILDEPTNSLDEGGVDMVKEILLRQKERGALIIIACHDYSILKEMSDEIFQLKNGRIIQHITDTNT
ncbi:MAG: ABC transporter ATP-binding protein [Oscillospiraceae bacterium]|jgi:ABC-2 type transport system ATP-binding protein|nr:ABC transporter ATP-binding protein [Oscillospiraceae bacterium]